MKPMILCIEGKYSGSPSFHAALEKKGYQVYRELTGKGALDHLSHNQPAVVVVNAPSMRTTGVRICHSIRKRWEDLPIILISCQEDRITEDDANVNLVLPLPFTIRKLNNRIKPLLPIESDKVLEIGAIQLDRERLIVRCQGKETPLTPKTAALLELLMEHPGDVQERETLFRKVWETNFTDDTRTLDVHISWLRQAIEENPRKPKFLKTLRGVGYRLDL
jgi:DNA-binding response OmpR family regulator